MKWNKGKIDGVNIKILKKHTDERGFLVEVFRLDELPEGLRPVMSYFSFTGPGISRGPHEHQKQTDIFAFLGPGNFLIKLWDNRKQSKTFGKYLEFYGGHNFPLTVIIPPGVVHGYKNISKTDPGMVINYPNQLYKGWHLKEPVDEIRYEKNKDSVFKL